MREREAKLVVSRDFELPSSDRLGEQVASSTTETVEQHAVYFDTRDLRLTRSGVSLRFRSDDGWTVKLPESQTSSTLTRIEHAFAGEAGTPPPNAVSLVRAWARTRPLVEIASVDTHRRRTVLVDQRGAVLAELDDDDVAGRSAGDAATAFREIEVELAEGTPAAFLDGVVRALRSAGAEPGDSMSKVARVLGEAAQAPPDLPATPEPGKGATVEDLVRAAFVRSVRQLIEYDPAVRLTEDAEAVHKARVATRRLRSDLRTLRPVLDRGWSEPLRAELKWLGGVLGKVRDADVLLDALERKADALPDERRRDAARLRMQLRKARVRDRDALLRVLDSNRYARLLERLVTAVAHPRLRDAEAAKEPALEVARTLAAKPRKRFRSHVRTAGRQAADAELHEARKRAKQARYAHELVAPIVGKKAAKVAQRFADVQQVLGDHQDAVVASEWLSDAARNAARGGEAFTSGELAGLFLVDEQDARAKWPAVRKRSRRARV